MKLYPPIIEGKISAQSGTELIIPFRFNRSVSAAQVSAVQVKIKTAVSGTEKMLQSSENFGASAQGDYEVRVPIAADLLAVGQYYKIQLACVDAGGVIGYFSSIGVFKYTSVPEISILGFEDGNANRYEYVGYYYNENDLSEKVASYCFEIKRRSDNFLYATSGELIHDTGTDEITGESKDTYELETSLQEGEVYEISYKITTVNGLEASSPSYEIVASDTLPNPFVGKLIATSVPESGCISLRFEGEQQVVGQGYGFVISRSDSESDFTVWRDVTRFSVARGSALPQELENDYSIEQGKTYKYALQLYQNSGLRSTRVLSDEVVATFEDMFLSDGERQLRIRFNPKVTSIKTNVLESKTDTLGGQYPFFFRNGDTNYKEFPISGLISYWMDEAEEFMSLLELGLEQRMTNLEVSNVKAEREFKLKVLEWLNNGKPKLLRSPVEGNYIVRLMNVSASPNDTLGRMLHTFSCTAYEIAECSYKNMVKYGFVYEQGYNEKILYLCSEIVDSNFGTKMFAEKGGAVLAQLRNVPSGSKFQVKYSGSTAPLEIVIGSSGFYNFNIYDQPIEWIALVEIKHESSAGKPVDDYSYLDYGVYEEAVVEDFSEVSSITYSTQMFEFSTNYPYSRDEARLYATYNNLKLKIGYVYLLKVATKKIETVYQNGDKYYSTEAYTHEVSTTGRDTLYQVNGTNIYIDGFTGLPITTLEPDYKINVEYTDGTSQTLDLSGPKEIVWHSLNNIAELRVGNGVLASGAFQQGEYTYGIELTTLKNLHDAYIAAKGTDEYADALAALLRGLEEAGIKGV